MATKNAVAASSAAVTSVKQQSITNFLESPLDKTKMMPLMTSTPRNSNISQKRKALDAIDKDQMILDVGQKNIGMTNCQDCGMVYNIDDIKDREAHDNFHNRFEKTKYFKVEKRSLNSWKKHLYNEVNVGKVSGTIFKVGNKGKSSLKKVMENIIKEIVDVQLHICEDVPVFDPIKVTTGFVYVVDGDKTEQPYVGAVVMTEKVFAAKLMPTGKIYRDLNKDHGFIAIERLWVHPIIRRKGIATHLLDVVRRLYSTTHYLQRSRIAFNDPNQDCIKFGKKFLDKGGRWIQYDGDEGNDSIQAGLQMETEDECPLPKKKAKNEVINGKKIVKVENEDIKPPKALIKIEDKENEDRKEISTSKVKDEP